jgi:hypothetical protein
MDCPTHDQPSFILGTGADTLTPILDGQDLSMTRGPQGGCHFWLAFRTDGFAEYRFSITYDVFDLTAHQDTKSQSVETVDLMPSQDHPGQCAYFGFTAYLIEPWVIQDHEVRLGVGVMDDLGRTATVAHTLIARWPKVPMGVSSTLACGRRT